MTDKAIRTRFSRRVRSTLMVSAIMLSIAACGDDDNSSSDTAAPTSAAAAATTVAAATTAAPATTEAPATTSAATTPAAAATTTSAAASGGAAQTVAVTESEFKIDLPSLTMTAGDYIFDVTNSGSFPHNLSINGPGVDNSKTPNLAAGENTQLAVTLQPGTYEFYCGVPTHKGKGMDLTVTVA